MNLNDPELLLQGRRILIPNTALEILGRLVSSTGSGEKVKIKLAIPCHHTLATHINEKSCFKNYALVQNAEIV